MRTFPSLRHLTTFDGFVCPKICTTCHADRGDLNRGFTQPHIDIMIDSTDTPTFVDASGNIVATDTAPQIVKAFSFSGLLIPESNRDTYRNRTMVAIFFENPNRVVVPDGITQVHNVQTNTWTPLLGTGCRVHVFSHMYIHVIGKDSPATTNANVLAVQADSTTNANVLAVQADSTTNAHVPAVQV